MGNVTGPIAGSVVSHGGLVGHRETRVFVTSGFTTSHLGGVKRPGFPVKTNLRKKVVKSWLFDGDPYNGLLQSPYIPYTWFIFNPFMMVYRLVKLPMFFFSPRSLGKWSNLTFTYFSNGLVQPALSFEPEKWKNHLKQTFHFWVPNVNFPGDGIWWNGEKTRGMGVLTKKSCDSFVTVWRSCCFLKGIFCVFNSHLDRLNHLNLI